jgi:hypothetical protein
VQRKRKLDRPMTFSFLEWFRASAKMKIRSAFFWDLTQRRVVSTYWRLGIT